MIRSLCLAIFALCICLALGAAAPAPAKAPPAPVYANFVTLGFQCTIDPVPIGYRITVHVRYTSDHTIAKRVWGHVWNTNVPEGDWMEAGSDTITSNCEGDRVFYYYVLSGTDFANWIANGGNVELRARMTSFEGDILVTAFAQINTN